MNFQPKVIIFILFNLLSNGNCLASNPLQQNNYNCNTNQDPPTLTIISKKNGVTTSHHIYNPSSSSENHGVVLKNHSTKAKKYKGTIPSSSSNLNKKITSALKATFLTTFLPNGYPDKTPKGYMSYSIWSWIQDLSTQLRAVVATQKVLEGVGVGRQGATALSASLNFIVRDGCGMASTLLFTAITASKFRSDVKRWRLVADLMNDIGISFEVAATLVPKQFFLPMICVGNMCKAICGVAAGACNGAINLHWSKGSDISDINAKFGAQHTVTGALGLVFAAIFAKSISSVSTLTLLSIYASLTLLHIFANVKCMKLIAFDYFNTGRMNTVLDKMLSKRMHTQDVENLIKNDNRIDQKDSVSIDSPSVISRYEPLFFGSLKLWKRKLISIRMGVSFDHIQDSIKSYDDKDYFMESYIDQICRDGYIVASGKNRKEVLVAINMNSDTIIRTKSYFHAFIFRKMLLERSSGKYSMSSKETTTLRAVGIDASNEVDQLWPQFFRESKHSGWDLTKTDLGSIGYEIKIA